MESTNQRKKKKKKEIRAELIELRILSTGVVKIRVVVFEIQGVVLKSCLFREKLCIGYTRRNETVNSSESKLLTEASASPPCSWGLRKVRGFYEKNEKEEFRNWD